MVNVIYLWLKLTKRKNFGAISEVNFQNRSNTTIPGQSCGQSFKFSSTMVNVSTPIFVKCNISGATTLNESKNVENYSNILPAGEITKSFSTRMNVSTIDICCI